MDVMNSVRRLGSSPGVRTVAMRPGVRRALSKTLQTRFLVAAWQTTEPTRLLKAEFARKGSIGTYRLRGTGIDVQMQHGRDLEALFELFSRGEYEPPVELADRVRRARVILDIGGNVGMFSAWALAMWPDAQIVTFEPMPSNLALLEPWADQYARVEVVPAAATTALGVIAMEDHGGGSTTARGSAEGIDVPAVDAFDWLDRADFVKMDIEGGEWPLLADPRLATLDNMVLVMEYHRAGAPSLPARQAAVDLLTAAGFETGFGSHNHWGHGTLWAWKGSGPTA